MKRLFVLLIILFLFVPFITISQCTTISDGTYGNSQTSPLSPMYGLYDYSWSSNIYYPANIGAAKTIGSISWYVDGFQSGYSQTGPYTFSNIKVYFAYTTLSGWANTNNVSGLNRLTGVNVSQGITSWTKVYDGSITFNASDVWKTITLDTPFSYDGVTNLVVHVENWDGTYASGYPIFHYTNYLTTRTMKYGAQDGSMGPTSGTRYYARSDIQFCSTSTLPIELLHFKPYYEDDIVKMEWVTASENNNDYFTIEKSYDGINYEIVKTIDGAGNSTHQIFYYTEDRDIRKNTVIYYRLKQTDYNGDFVRTSWKSVYIESLDEIMVYPNPINQEINLILNSKLNLDQTLYIFDLVGNVIYTENLLIEKGNNEFKINLPNLSKGVYTLKLGTSLIKIEKL